MTLAPAILVHDKAVLERELALARQMSDRAQFDFIDGEFAQNQTVTLADLMVPAGLKIDLDMMVARPSEHIEAALATSPNLIIWHIECSEALQGAIEQISESGVKVGVALNPATPVEQIAPLLPIVDHVLVMGVPAGFAGQSFDRGVLEKASALRQLKPELEIGLDGGQNADTLSAAASAHFDIVYVNSAVFKADDPAVEFNKLKGVVV